MHLLADDPPLDPASNPALHVTVAACGALGGIWVHPIPGNVPCEACVDAAPLPDRSPQPPTAASDTQDADAGPYRGDEPDSRDDNFDWPSFSDLLPPGAVPVRGVKIVEYLDEDGEVAYEWRRFGSASLIQLIGMIEFTKLRMHAKAFFPDEE